MNTLKCNRCTWHGNIHQVDGITLAERKDLDQMCISNNQKTLDIHNGLCPTCMSYQIAHIN